MKKYTYEEVYNKSLEYFYGDEMAAKTFTDKYSLQDREGNFYEPTPDEMHRRLAKEFARIEKKYANPLDEETIYNYFQNFTWIVPQGSPMNAIGNDFQVQSASNCFVISPPEDSYAGIMRTDQEEAQIMKRRGGVGFDISTIRPRGSTTANAAKTTDGIGLFMERFSNTCREVAQGGRRGALMLTISVHHPEIRTFIHIKEDLKKVTGANISIRLTDEFMEAVRNDANVELRFPVEKNVKHSQAESTSAKALWDEIIEAAWKSAEPGLLFWDTALKYTPSDIYEKFGYRSTATNPCFSGDTLIAVADGRNAITIKQLVEEGKDVPVYSVDKNTGIVSIKMGRNPRITGENKKLIRINLDDNSSFDVTPDHKILLLDGTEIMAKDLKNGMSLPRFTKKLEPVKSGGKDYYRVYCDVNDTHKNKIFEHRLISKFYDSASWEEKLAYAKEIGFAKTGGVVVHHKDYNHLNNSPNNLQVMTWEEHQKLHASLDSAGENNGKYSGITNNELKQHAINLTKKLGYRFSNNDWVNYAKGNNLPQSFSKFRKVGVGSVNDLAVLSAIESGIDNYDCDPRLVKTLKNMLEQGYSAKIIDNVVMVNKICEKCGCEFEIEHNRREISFCSNKCSLETLNYNVEITNKRINSTKKAYFNRSVKLRQEQAKLFSQLKFELGRKPFLKEWEQKCKENGLSYRLNTKNGFKSFKDVCYAGENYNHKVVSIEEIDGWHTVYNITVDDNHTVGLITSINDKNNNKWYSGVFTPQCGEIILSNFDSCRLLVVNLLSFVIEPFTVNARFDYAKYKEVVMVAQRLMDDMIDLELEQIDKILDKIKADPERADTKLTELTLWNSIKKACSAGRRTGLGITALGDTLAALNVKYGSDHSIELTEEIYRNLAINAYTATCLLAKERGAFPIYDYDLEKDHVFIKRVMEQDEELQKLYKKYGRRNIALTTTAPTGCSVKETKILTSDGLKTISDIFDENGIDVNELEKEKVSNKWFSLKKEMFVPDVDGENRKITKLYANGYANTKKITFEDGTNFEATYEHKVLVLDEENPEFGVWKKIEDLKENDKIIQLSPPQV